MAPPPQSLLECLRNLSALAETLHRQQFADRRIPASSSKLLFEPQVVQTVLQPPRQEARSGIPEESEDEQDPKHALIYIVVVLLFYSLSIVILMIKYIRIQRRQYEEEKMLRDILSKARQLTYLENKYMSARHYSRRLKQHRPHEESRKSAACLETTV